MKRAALVLAAMALPAIALWKIGRGAVGLVGDVLTMVRCYRRGQHNPTRHFMGGFRCGDCGAVGADLAEMGFEDSSEVPTLRRVFSRGRDGGQERIAGWGEPERADRPSVDQRFRRGRHRRPA